MKYVSLVIAAIFVMWAGLIGAEEAKKAAPVTKTVSVAGEKPGEKAVSTDMDEAADIGEKDDSGVNRENLMPPGQTYDTNTGMPNAVGSDTAGEIE